MKRIMVLFAAMAIALILSSCGASDDASQAASSQAASSEGDVGVYYAADYVAEGAQNLTPEIPASAPNPDTQGSRKLIKRASLTIETKDFDAAISAAEALCADFGGYIENSSIYGGDKAYSSYGQYNQRSADYTMRIPEQSYEEFLQQAGNIGNVTYKSRSAEDITDAYYDTASRLAATETRRDRLMELLESAYTMDAIIELEKALSDTIYEIDSYTGTLQLYDNQVEYSFININLTEVIAFSPADAPPITLGERITEAGRDAWLGLTNGAQSLLVWFIRNIFTLIILAVIAVAAILIVRRSNTSKRKNSGTADASENKTGEPKA
ncbi:MAG: DUF4349 domain-containing protein [Oscillospiraceae bacterium]|jgi:hypothetical protein|nr:DUF4349 domain-containing protein [Oscillospiraceae bacterium]